MDKTLPYWDKFARGLNFYRMLILDLNIDHVVRVEFKGPSTVGTPGMSHSVAHSALVGPCHFLFWLPENINSVGTV